MTNDHRELIEQVRKEHAERRVTKAYPVPLCGWDMESWPCLATRLADALAAARKALDEMRSALVTWGEHSPECVYRGDVRAVCDCGIYAALSAPPSPPSPCASCGQDPAGGHNFGCPDGAGL